MSLTVHDPDRIWSPTGPIQYETPFPSAREIGSRIKAVVLALTGLPARVRVKSHGWVYISTSAHIPAEVRDVVETICFCEGWAGGYLPDCLPGADRFSPNILWVNTL